MFLVKTISVCAAVCAVAFGAQMTRATNIINNSGFETAPTTPVTPNDWQYSSGASQDNSNPYSGSFEANLNNTTEATNANVFQQTAFGSVTAGTQYTFSFYSEFQGGNGGIAQAQIEFMPSGGGVIGAPTFINLPTTATGFGTAAGYQLTSQNITAPTGASAAFVSFNAITGAVTGSFSHAYIDNVSLAPPALTPEPTSLGILAIGAAASLLVLRRRRLA